MTGRSQRKEAGGKRVPSGKPCSRAGMGRCQLRSFTQRTEGRWEVLSASAIAKPTREQSARCLTWVTNERTEPPFATYSAGLNRGQSRAKQAAGPDSSRAKPCGTPQARCSSRRSEEHTSELQSR